MDNNYFYKRNNMVYHPIKAHKQNPPDVKIVDQTMLVKQNVTITKAQIALKCIEN